MPHPNPSPVRLHYAMGQSIFILPRLNMRIPRISAKRMGSCIRIDLCLLCIGGRPWVRSHLKT
jgi:hypothetical protein